MLLHFKSKLIWLFPLSVFDLIFKVLCFSREEIHCRLLKSLIIISISLLSGETFSENFSHTEKCQACTQCTGLLRMETPCTDANDAICVCNYGYYFNAFSQKCEPCTKCPEGQGMLLSCERDHDTTCEECNGDTYSDQESSREPCIPCTTCDDGQVLQVCTSVSDTVCQGKTINSHRLIVKFIYVPACNVASMSLYSKGKSVDYVEQHSYYLGFSTKNEMSTPYLY